VFPEGKLSEDGLLQPFLPGALMAATRANVPIIPTALIATDKLMPYGKTTPRHAGQPVVVRFGKPVTPAELTGGLKGSDGLKLGAERLRLLVQALLDNDKAFVLPPISPNHESGQTNTPPLQREPVSP
jgi:1-acyl-sn-glycerol-3-phosphate acyltransferase